MVSAHPLSRLLSLERGEYRISRESFLDKAFVRNKPRHYGALTKRIQMAFDSALQSHHTKQHDETLVTNCCV
jgi:hypothetical protein